jgi:hypothetical protein
MGDVEAAAELVLTAPNDERGQVAVDRLKRHGPIEVGCHYETSLSDQLVGRRASGLLLDLPHTFHRVKVVARDAYAAAERIVRFYNGEVRDRGRIDAAELNEGMVPSIPYLGLPFSLGGEHNEYLKAMKAPDAHRNGVKGRGVRVAIVDSGLQSTGSINVADFYDVQDPNPINPGASSVLDNDGHGTAMASLAAAVAPEADIYIVRVMDQGALYLWNVLAGTGIAAYDCNADVISLSLGFDTFSKCRVCGATSASRSIAFERLLEGIARSSTDVICVASTGNEGQSTHINYPAAYDMVVPIGSVRKDGDRSSFSNYDQNAAHHRLMVAPGGERTGGTVTEDVGSGGGIQCCGTSVATAYAAGMLAILRSDSARGYDTLDREAFLDKVMRDNCARTSTQPQVEYGAGLIQYQLPAAGGDSDVVDDNDKAPAVINRGDHLEIRSKTTVNVPINPAKRNR